ncbi:hypothetical protein Tco_1199386 [Tanacetum coccineum]
MSLTTVPVVMKHVQSMSSSVTPVRRYGNHASGYKSYMLAVHSELSNSTQWNVPKPLGKLGPPDLTVVQSHSETVYPRPIHQLSKITKSAYLEYPLSQHKYHVYPNIPNAIADLLVSLTFDLGIHSADKPIIRSMTSTSGMSSLRSTGGCMNSEAGSGGSGDNGNGNDVGTGGGKCSDDGGGGSDGEGI